MAFPDDSVCVLACRLKVSASPHRKIAETKRRFIIRKLPYRVTGTPTRMEFAARTKRADCPTTSTRARHSIIHILGGVDRALQLVSWQHVAFFHGTAYDSKTRPGSIK